MSKVLKLADFSKNFQVKGNKGKFSSERRANNVLDPPKWTILFFI